MTLTTLPERTPEMAPVRVKRTWFRLQFGLRSLLVFTLLMGAAGGFLSRWIARANRQREVVAKLLEAGFYIQYDHGVSRRQMVGKSPVEGDYFWEKVDFWHNVVQLQTIYLAYRSPETIQLIAELPHLEKIEVLVAYQEDAVIPPFPRLACRKQLKLFKINNFPLQSGDLSRIAECEFLTSLDIMVDEASSRELAALDRLQQLQSLRIEGSIAEEAVAAWQNLARLEVLYLGDIQEVSGKTLAAFLRRNPNLRRVELGNANCTVEVCEALATCRGLAHLSLANSQLDDEGLTKLRPLAQLAGLTIAKTRVRGTAFDGTGSFLGLRQLNGKGSPIDDQGAFLVARLAQLRSLDLSHTKVTDTACEYLGRCQLVTLDLSSNAITDLGINSLHCERLAKLNLDQTAVSPRAFASASQWPNLELLIVSEPAENEADLERVLQIPTLKSLYANGPTSPEFLERHSQRFVELRKVSWRATLID